MAERETGNLIGTDKVEGTAVYGADREKIGSIERVMLEKVSGKASYAVLGFGGYLTNVTKDQLQGAPKYSNDADWDWQDTGRARKVDDYYGTPFV